MRAVAQSHRMEVVVDDAAIEAYLDYVEFGQVVAKLIENAAKFSPPGTTILVSGQSLGGETVIAVADQGRGVAPEDRARVFDRFYRGASASSVPGSGLGLAISRGIARAHGGEIRLEAGPAGSGAVFTISIPRPLRRRSHAAAEGAIA